MLDLTPESTLLNSQQEFFLHHEGSFERVQCTLSRFFSSNCSLEQYHSTPETQTDEAYTHPEDIEHFGHHAAIEREEAEREAKYQGITVEEAIRVHEEPPTRPAESAPRPKITRGVPPEKQDPVIKYKDIGKEGGSQSDWGTGEQGYKQPNTPVEKMR